MKQLAVSFAAVVMFFLGFYFNQVSICNSLNITGSQTISAIDFKRRLSTCHPLVLDVRTADEFNSGHISDANNADYYQTESFSNYLDKLDKTKPYYIYCRTGKRATAAMKLMTDKGFKKVYNLDGGITAWTSAGLPVVK